MESEENGCYPYLIQINNQLGECMSTSFNNIHRLWSFGLKMRFSRNILYQHLTTSFDFRSKTEDVDDIFDFWAKNPKAAKDVERC